MATNAVNHPSPAPARATAPLRLGVDLGGSKIEIVALDRDGAERLRRRVPTPRGDYRATIAAVAGLVAAAEAKLGAPGSVGVGMPGSLSPSSGLVRNANSVWLNGRPLQRDLETALARPVRLANDANCFALSEALDGAAANARIVFGVILGTGVGGGVVINGQLLEGASGIAGEWGHNPLPWPSDDERPGPACWCGLHGCIETWLSGPGLARDHAGHAAHPTMTRSAARAAAAGDGCPPASTQGADAPALAAVDIVAAAAAGDADSNASLARYEQRLARALASIINLLDPDVVVLGGGLSNVERFYARVPQQWERYVFSDRVDTRLVRHAHGDSSGVRGAAWLWGGYMPA
jgi:fructokinase